MSKTLYRKYRPQFFKEIIGQEHIKITIQNEIENDKIAHAYLFSGPHGIGKTTMARIFAKAVNCENRKKDQYEPCNKCNSCLAITNGNNLDLIEIDAASNRGINEIRELRERVKYAPAKSKYKIFIIDEAHMLTIEAFNALLKTLEEPPQHAIFILATTELHKLPSTIVSRCQRFDFKVVDIEKLTNHLKNVCSGEKIKVDKSIVEKIARHSGGYVRDALSILGQILSLSENSEVNEDTASLVLPKSNSQIIANLTDFIINQQFDLAIKELNKLSREGINLQYFTEELIQYLRRVLLIKISGASEKYLWDIDQNIEQKIIEQSAKLDIKSWYKILKIFYESFDNLENNNFQELPLEMAVISIKNEVFTDKEDHNDQNDDKSEKPPASPEGASAQSEGLENIRTKEQRTRKQETKKQNLEEKTKPNLKLNAKINLSEVAKIWPKLLINLKDHNHSLSAFVKVGHPLKIEKNKIILGFKFKFHLDRISQSKYKQIVEEILSDLLKTKVSIGCTIDDAYEENHRQSASFLYKNSEKDQDNNVIEDLIANFGGQVVK